MPPCAWKGDLYVRLANELCTRKLVQLPVCFLGWQFCLERKYMERISQAFITGPNQFAEQILPGRRASA